MLNNTTPTPELKTDQRVNGDADTRELAEECSAPQYSCSSRTLKLAQRDLERSGLTLADVAHESIFPVDDASLINPAFAKSAALILPYHDAHGRPLTYLRDGRPLPFCRARYLAAPGFPLPRKRKYDQPGDSGTPPYFPRAFDWQGFARGEVTSCVIVEGEKKATALCCVGIPAVAVGGVFNYADGSVPLHPEIAAIIERCDDVFVVFDSDAAENDQIQLAEWRLAGQIALAGARAHVVRIPPSGDAKQGADDYLVEHGAAALNDLILNTPALGDRTATTQRDEIAVADILAREVTPVEEIIPGWIEKGIPNFICGPGGVHKSRLAMQWGLCLNAGATVWGIGAGVAGLRASDKTTLVFCAAEDDANELARRAQAISSALKLKKPERGVFLARKGHDSALVIMHESADVEVRPFFHRLTAQLQGIAGHKVVVLDSAYDFVRFAGRAKIDEDAVNYFIKVVLQRLCDETDSTLIIPWHPSQAGSSRDTMDGWSVAWHNAPRARLALSAVDGVEDTYELKVVKRNHGRKGEPIRLKFHEGALVPFDAVPDDGKVAALRRVFVKAAIDAANINAPFNRQRAIPGICFADAEKALGRRPTKQEAKNALEDAVQLRELEYVTATRHRAAGYYPADSDLAKQMAVAAKRTAQHAEDAQQ